MSVNQRAYFGAVYGSLRRLARIALLRPKRPQVPILSRPLEQIVERHSWICSIIRDWAPNPENWRGRPVCEVGAGDCLAAASMMLGLGASHVTVIEHEPPVTGPKQAAALKEMRHLGFPCDPSILETNNGLNKNKCTYIQSYMENSEGRAVHTLVYSICVGEHVEDLPAFFATCLDSLVPGGETFHYIDLGGHGIFEDPVPPLDFHRYGDLAYAAVYPPYHRATRRFVSDYIKAAELAGFQEVRVEATRRADQNYLKSLRPHLKSRARRIPDEELSVVEFVLSAKKPD